MKKVCIYTGYSSIFYNGKNYKEKKVGGSEIATIKLAENLAKYAEVFVCGYNIEIGNYNGVSYNIPTFMENLLNDNIIDIIIVSRYIHFFTEFKNTAKQTYIWLHDNSPCPYLSGLSFNKNGFNLLYNYQNNIKKIICLSNSHKEFVIKNGILNKNISIIGNGHDSSSFQMLNKINLNRFIYISAFDRSLKEVLIVFLLVNNIKLKTHGKSDYELYIYCDIPKGNECINIIRDNNNIFWYGRIPHDQVIKELIKSGVWLYIPSSFHETYCISALEAQCAGCICFVNNIGSLGEVVGNRGYVFNDNDSFEYKSKIIYNKLNDTNFITEKRRLMNIWINDQTWEKRCEQWIKLLNL